MLYMSIDLVSRMSRVSFGHCIGSVTLRPLLQKIYIETHLIRSAAKGVSIVCFRLQVPHSQRVCQQGNTAASEDAAMALRKQSSQYSVG